MQTNIVEPARDAGTFTTLVAAIDRAGLESTLAGEGPITAFAPGDEAFAALPEGTVESLLATPERLAEVLTYHLVAGRVTAADAVGLTSAPTVQREELRVSVDDGVHVDGATGVSADIEASNGLIHSRGAPLCEDCERPRPRSGRRNRGARTDWPSPAKERHR